MGFAVISSDAGHQAPTPFFGIDPQARLDYGYQAVGKLTPMAKNIIQAAYGKGPDRSYFGGCSNGGRHAMVAAARYADQYDGFLVGNPGYRLPLAAIANVAGGKTYAALATTPGDLGSGFTLAERATGLERGAGQMRRARWRRRRPGAGYGCLPEGLRPEPRRADLRRHARRQLPVGGAEERHRRPVRGRRTPRAAPRSTPASRRTRAWRPPAGPSWKFTSPMQRDAGAIAFIWQVPPAALAGFDGNAFVLNANLDALLAAINATSATYPEKALSFMTPPDANGLATLKNRGAKMMVYHGTSDPIFSSDDTTAWYERLFSANGADTSNFARFFRVPGMNHCSGGPALDQFDMLTPLVNWVEQGQAPDSVTASARGAGNAGGVNTDLPAAWSATRSRPLCAVSESGALQGQRQHRGCGEFQLPVR